MRMLEVRKVTEILLIKPKKKFRFEDVSIEGRILLQRIFGK